MYRRLAVALTMAATGAILTAAAPHSAIDARGVGAAPAHGGSSKVGSCRWCDSDVGQQYHVIDCGGVYVQYCIYGSPQSMYCDLADYGEGYNDCDPWFDTESGEYWCEEREACNAPIIADLTADGSAVGERGLGQARPAAGRDCQDRVVSRDYPSEVGSNLQATARHIRV